MMRTYSELCRLHTLEDRFEYLVLGGEIGLSTFGFDRWLNQQFYHSPEWRDVRVEVTARDEGFDLGCTENPIMGSYVVIHHMNPITREDIEEGTANLLDPEYLISCALRTHNAIHFGNRSLLPQPYVERSPGDTLLWRR